MKKLVFESFTFGMQSKKMPLTWIERIALFFIKPQIAMDPGSGYGMTFKRFRGKMYVLEEWKVK